MTALLVLLVWPIPSGLRVGAQPPLTPDRIAETGPQDARSASIWDAQEDALIAGIIDTGKAMRIDPRFSRLLKTKRPVTRVSVTNPAIVEIVQFSPTEFELIGGRTGTTTLTFWIAGEDDEPEILRYLVEVAPDEAVEERREVEYGVLERKINELFPNSRVQLIPVADKLIVRGQARDAEEAAQILAIVRGGDSADDGTGRRAGVHGDAAATPFVGANDLPASNVINMLHVPGEMQVLLRVRVAELNRTALRNMGAELQIQAGDFTFESLFGIGGTVSAVLETSHVRLMLETFSANSYSKVLAEPNLVTLSGNSASFHAGGEFAVPTVVGVEGAAAVATSFRSFGTQLVFTPTVLDKDRIRLQVSPSISSVNADNAVDGIPGLDTRSVSTTVDLRAGQWLAIAGLLQDQQAGSDSRMPFVGNVPVLSTLFSRRSVRREESELIVLVSPELVHPLDAAEAPRILPGMEVMEPGDAAFFLGGRTEGRPDCSHRSTVWPNVQREILSSHRSTRRGISYQQTESYFLQGDHGFSR